MDANTISHRERWLAKLAYPSINTQSTRFVVVPAEVARGWWINETIELSKFSGVGRQSRRLAFIQCGYSERLDLCVIAR